MDIIEIKKTKNLFKSLINYEFSIFYAIYKVNRNFLKKPRKSFYAKHKILVKIYDNLKNKNDSYHNEVALPIHMSFIKDIYIDFSTFFSIKAPFKLIHSNIVDIRFLAKSAPDPK